MATVEGGGVLGLRQFGALGTNHRWYLHPSLAESFRMETIQARMVPRLTQGSVTQIDLAVISPRSSVAHGDDTASRAIFERGLAQLRAISEL